MEPLVTKGKMERIIEPKDVQTLELLPIEAPITSTRSQIHRAAKEGSLQVLKNCLKADPHGKNNMDDKGMAAIHYASQCNQKQAINELIHAGADVNIRGIGNITPLHVAARHNAVDAVDILTSNKADPYITCATTGCTPFLVAVRMENIKVVQLLLSKYPKVLEDRDLHGLTALHWACLRGSYEICELLVRKGANIGQRTKDGRTPIAFAVECNDKRLLPMLLDKGEKMKLNMSELINGHNDDTTTPFVSAILAGNADAVQLLLEKGASVEGTQNNQSTPLHMAATNGDDKIVKLLLVRGARVGSKDTLGRTPLHRAAVMGHLSVIRMLVDSNADMEVKDNDGRSPLLCAISTGQGFAVKLLVTLGADIMSRDHDMRTGLHLSAIEQQYLIMNMILKDNKKTLQSMSDFQEQIPLHYAAVGEDTRILQTLVENGSNCGFKDLSRATPLHLAAIEGLPEHVELILKAAPSTVHERDLNGFTPLHLAALNKNWETCDTLLKMGAEVDAHDSDSRSPLFQASISGSLPLIEHLLNHHANIDHTDATGNTALHAAAQAGNSAIVKALLDKGALRVLNDHGESCLDVAIASKSSDVINTIVKHERWEEFIHVDRGGCYIMSKLISDFPDAVTLVMDKCIIRSHHKPTDPNFSLTFNFQLLDPGPDRVYTTKEAQSMSPILTTKTPGEKRFYGMMEMVKNKRKELLVHPLASRLRRIKWRRFGVLIYVINFVMHAAFAGLLTHFILNVRGKIKIGPDAKGNRCSSGVTKMQEGIASIILGIVIFHLIKEIVQMFTQRWRYFTDLTNLFEFIMYAFALVFVIPYSFKGTDICTNPRTMIWNFGTTAVFMAYFDLILLTRTISFIGIYVTMFMEVFKTLLKVMVLCMLFIMAFSIVFYIIFRNQDAFDEFGESVVKTMVMTVGELDYLSLLVDSENQTTSSGASLVPYPTLSYMFIFFFVMVMPIVLMNLLVGLAVGDINAIQNHAFLSRIGRHVEFLTDIEKNYPLFLTRKLYAPTWVIYPRQMNNVIWNMWTFFGQSFEKLMLEEGNEETVSPDPEDDRYREIKSELKEVKDRLKTMTQILENQTLRKKSVITASQPSIAEGRRSVGGEDSSSF